MSGSPWAKEVHGDQEEEREETRLKKREPEADVNNRMLKKNGKERLFQKRKNAIHGLVLLGWTERWSHIHLRDRRLSHCRVL